MRPVMMHGTQCTREPRAMLGVAVGAVLAARNTGICHAAIALALTVGGE